MAFVIGLVLALAVGVCATTLRLDRDRAFYPTVLLVIAFLYILFAAIGGGSGRVFLIESLIASVFVVAASVGFRKSMWLVAAGLAGHGVMDFFHGQLVANPGVPAWWPAFCGAYDVAAAGYLAWRLTRNPAPADVVLPDMIGTTRDAPQRSTGELDRPQTLANGPR